MLCFKACNDPCCVCCSAGMYTFDNPLQGAIVGPMLLSLLSVFFNLHSQYMGSAALSQQLSGMSSQRATMSRSASFDSSAISRFRPVI